MNEAMIKSEVREREREIRTNSFYPKNTDLQKHCLIDGKKCKEHFNTLKKHDDDY